MIGNHLWWGRSDLVAVGGAGVQKLGFFPPLF